MATRPALRSAIIAAFFAAQAAAQLGVTHDDGDECTVQYTSAYMSTLNGACSAMTCSSECQAHIDDTLSACADQTYNETEPLTGLVATRSFAVKAAEALRLMGPLDCDYPYERACPSECTVEGTVATMGSCLSVDPISSESTPGAAFHSCEGSCRDRFQRLAERCGACTPASAGDPFVGFIADAARKFVDCATTDQSPRNRGSCDAVEGALDSVCGGREGDVDIAAGRMPAYPASSAACAAAVAFAGLKCPQSFVYNQRLLGVYLDSEYTTTAAAAMGQLLAAAGPTETAVPLYCLAEHIGIAMPGSHDTGRRLQAAAGAESSVPHLESGQVWTGHYLCEQGDTNLQLEITEVDEDFLVQAIFDFDFEHNGCSGRYTVSGMLQADGSLVLEPEQIGSETVGWLENRNSFSRSDNPCHYVSVGMVGAVTVQSSGEMIYSGTIDDGSYGWCEDFMVSHGDQPPPGARCEAPVAPAHAALGDCNRNGLASGEHCEMTCETGWCVSGSQPTCEDGELRTSMRCEPQAVESCSYPANGGCDPLTTCSDDTNLFGTKLVQCSSCPPGYYGSGRSGCYRVDQCLVIRNGGCDARTTCSNFVGGYSCSRCEDAVDPESGSNLGLVGNPYEPDGCYNPAARARSKPAPAHLSGSSSSRPGTWHSIGMLGWAWVVFMLAVLALNQCRDRLQTCCMLPYHCCLVSAPPAAHAEDVDLASCKNPAAADDAEAAPLELQKQQAHYGPTTMDLDEVAAKVRSSSSSSSGMSQAECGPTTSDEGERSPALEKPLGC